MDDLFELLISAIFDLGRLFGGWRWMVAMLLGAGAAWALACAVPSRMTGWVCLPILLVACVTGIWWEARSA